MAENKTRPTDLSVDQFIAGVEGPRRADADAIAGLMSKVTGEPARMWGSAIIGFGSYHYRYESGREGDAPLTGFSPRKGEFALYIMGAGSTDNVETRDALLAQLGKHRMGKGCLCVKRLADIDVKVLEKLVKLGVDAMRRAYPDGPV